MKFMCHACVLLLAAIACAACGSSGSSSPTAPSATSSTTAAPATPVSNTIGSITLTFDAATSASDQQLIRDGVTFAQAYFQTSFGRQIQQATTVAGAASASGCAVGGGAAAFTGPGAVTFCVANQGWTANGPINKQKIVIHELFHVWQFEYHWLGNTAAAGATWIVEGSAELVGYRSVASRGVLPADALVGCMRKQVADFAQQQPPGLPDLSTMEAPQSFQQPGPRYALAMLAMDQLVARPGLASLRTYGDAIAGGTAWSSAFQSVFGTSTTTFYAQFPGYLASVPVPASYVCGG